jgi:glycosyltransferase involved in cell wall biosynthesis
MRVLVASNMYPSRTSPFGTFIKEQVADLEAVGVDVAKVVKRGEGRAGYPFFAARLLGRCLLPAHDLVHAHYGFHSGLIPELLKSRPTVVTFHRGDALDEPRRNRLYGRLQRYVVASADHIIGVSREVMAALEALGADPGRMTRLSCGVNTTRFAPLANRGEVRRGLGLEERLTVVFSGELCHRKGVDVLLACARRLPDLRFLFIGAGPLKASQPNCLFAGAVAHPAVPLWLNAADIFALPSRSEGAPVALLEAMACGLPAVCTDTGDCRGIIRDGRTGFLVPVNDARRLEERLRYLAEHPEARTQIGAAARADISARYAGPVIAGAIKDIYLRVLSEGPRRSPAAAR